MDRPVSLVIGAVIGVVLGTMLRPGILEIALVTIAFVIIAHGVRSVRRRAPATPAESSSEFG